MGRPARSGLAALAAAALLSAAAASCTDGGGGTAVLAEDIHGFRLGERFDDFSDRLGNKISWTEIPSNPAEPRDRMFAVPRPPDRDGEIERVRLAFFEDRLMEVILYYRQTTFSKLEALRRELEERYGNEATSPDGTIEMAYKTYWIRGPGMSVTIRRFTKKPENELYVQYLHDGLHERFKAQKSGG